MSSARGGDPTRRLARDMAGACLLTRARRVSRLVSRIFDRALEPHELTCARANLLVAIAVQPGIQPADLARHLDWDKSTLSRDLSRMVADGLVRVADKDGRSRTLWLTSTGRARLRAVHDAWARAQAEAEARLGVVAGALRQRFPMPGDA